MEGGDAFRRGCYHRPPVEAGLSTSPWVLPEALPGGTVSRTARARSPPPSCCTCGVWPGGVSMTTNPDPAASPPLALAGRIITLDAAATIVASGVVYCRDGSIVAVQPASASAPPGFENVAVTQTRGTVLPGMIELHNHLPYDVLSLWQVPKAYTNRDQWSAETNPDYHRLVTAPMRILGSDPNLVD